MGSKVYKYQVLINPKSHQLEEKAAFFPPPCKVSLHTFRMNEISADFEFHLEPRWKELKYRYCYILVLFY